jgi:rubrerythrin
MNKTQVTELILQSLEHELGGIKVYEAAVSCAVNDELRQEWAKYLAETQTHVTALQQVCQALGIDAARESPGRAVVRHLGGALVEAMKMALSAGEPAAAELVACECVVLAETKDHLDWQLIGKCAQHLEGDEATALKAAYDVIEDQEDEHLYHSKGWCRELWVQSLGMTAVLPPPEETRHVKTAIGAAKAEQAAEKAR